MHAVTGLMLQEYAWLAAAIGAPLAIIQLVFNLIREHRLRRREQAKFGYDLLDALFNDRTASLLLSCLDSGPYRQSQATEDAKLRDQFARAFGAELESPDEALVQARMQFDSVLYRLDRIEHAILAGLTCFDDVRAPLAWYAGLLQPHKRGITLYAEQIGYRRSVAFLKRFMAWRT